MGSLDGLSPGEQGSPVVSHRLGFGGAIAFGAAFDAAASVRSALAIWAAAFGAIASGFAKALECLPQLGFVNEAVAVGVDPVEVLLQAVRGFFFGELAVAIRIGNLQALGGLSSWPALAGASFSRTALARTAWWAVGRTSEEFIGTEFAVTVAIELEQRLAGCFNLTA